MDYINEKEDIEINNKNKNIIYKQNINNFDDINKKTNLNNNYEEIKDNFDENIYKDINVINNDLDNNNNKSYLKKNINNNQKFMTKILVNMRKK